MILYLAGVFGLILSLYTIIPTFRGVDEVKLGRTKVVGWEDNTNDIEFFGGALCLLDTLLIND